MNYFVYKNADEVGKAAAAIFTSQVLRKKNSVLGFATGSTPVPTYQHMIKLYEEGIVDYSQVTTYNLDEYCGLDASHDQSFSYFMFENLFNHINVPKDKIHIPDGTAADMQAECDSYEAAIQQAGGIDLQIVGIGANGHIGFNEPDDKFIYATHQTQLTQSTIDSNKRFFASADEVPRQAVTMGIGTIMQARSIVMVATEKTKAQAVKDMLQKEPAPQYPATVLQFHQNVTVLLDADAASLL